MLHRHFSDGVPDRFHERQERGPDLGRHGAAGIIAVEDRDPAPVLVVVDDRHEVLPERDGPAGLLVRRLPVLLRDERRGCKDRVVVEQPLLDEQPEGKRDLIAVVLPQVRGLLADLDDAPEEGVLVGRVGAVAFDDGVDPAVLGEIHAYAGEIGGRGDMGVGFVIRGLDGSVPCSRFHNRARADRTLPQLQLPDEELSACWSLLFKLRIFTDVLKWEW